MRVFGASLSATQVDCTYSFEIIIAENERRFMFTRCTAQCVGPDEFGAIRNKYTVFPLSGLPADVQRLRIPSVFPIAKRVSLVTGTVPRSGFGEGKVIRYWKSFANSTFTTPPLHAPDV